MEYLKVNWKYLRYVLIHKAFVFWAGLHIMPVGVWKKVRFFFRLVIHDYSKFYPSEWVGYRDWFNARPESGTRAFARAKDRFDTAWLKHIHRQDHHWQHWTQSRDATSVHTGSQLIQPPIPELAMREMVADWAGAGRTIHGEWEVLSWYLENEEEIKAHDESRRYLKMYVRQINSALP